MGTIHAADPARSPRLKKVLDFLRKRGETGATTREIIHECDVCAVNAIVAELRAAGYSVTCETRVLAPGTRVARYTLNSRSAQSVEGDL